MEQPLEVELWPDDHGDDVSFRRERTRRSRPGRGKWVAAAGLGAIGIVVAVATLGSDDDPEIASATTAVTPSTNVAAPPSTVDGTTTVPAAYQPLAALDGDPGWDVYLSDGSGPLRVFDPVSGRVEVVGENADSFGVVRDENGGVRFLPYRSRVFGDTAPLPDGTGWALVPSDGGRGRPVSIARLSADGDSVLETVQTQPGTALAIANFVRLVGTTAADRPVVVAIDRRSYEVEGDGTMTLFADGLVETYVDRGRFAETSCEDAGRCVLRLHRPDTEPVTVPSLGLLVAASFSPDGSRVVTLEFAAGSSLAVRVIDLELGELLRVDHGRYSYGSARLPGWSPDGRFFFYRADGSLNVYDSAANAVVPVPVAAESIVPDDLQVAGVA